MSSKNDARYSASSSMMPQRPFSPERRRTPSPPPGAYPPYDRYIPQRGPGSPYRVHFPASYRVDPWHADRQYAGNPPSPDRYRPPRPPGDEAWRWRLPEEMPWYDRRPAAAEAYEPVWRPRRDTMAQPMFEPSDNWKQSHGSAADVPDADGRDWSYDRYAGEPTRDPRDRSPERLPPRDPYAPPYVPGERFRRFSGPPPLRDPPIYAARSESYRPQYEEHGSWSASPYHPGGMEMRNRDPRPLRESRFVPRIEAAPDRGWYSRERSISGGSVQNSPLPSPIRTRTNLPDRAPPSHSRSNSGSYPQSPVNKPVSHPTWDVEPTPSSKRTSRFRSRSASQEISLVSSRKSEARNDESTGPWMNGQPTRSPSPTISSKPVPPASQSPSPEPQVGTEVIPQQLPHDGVADSFRTGRSSDSGGVRFSTSTAVSTEGNVSIPALTSSRPMHQVQESRPSPSPQPTLPDGRQPVPVESQRVSPPLLKLATKGDDGDGSSRFATSAMRVPSRDSSPEPDIPLAILAKHGSITRASTSGPSTPLPEQSEPPSRDEVAPPIHKWLAPNIHHPTEPIPLHEALRAVVMIRLQRDRQTQEERVTPILLDNLSKVEQYQMPSVASPEDVIRDVTTGSRKKGREEAHDNTKKSLQVRFAQRQADLTAKVAKLREEYMGLHRQWLVHCGKLDDVAKLIALQEAAATAGRTTRRSLATMGDAVRSDLEMEQIIASLGNEEMTDANHLGAKNAAVIPDMIVVSQGEVDHLYDDTNNEVENPDTYYFPRTGIDDWTEEEVTIFLDKFGEFPKQFGIIADFLPNKTPSQCVTFYYLHKNKHIDFRQVVARRVTKRKRGGRKQKSNALLADIRKRDDEVSASGSSRRRRAPATTASDLRKTTSRRAAIAVAQAEQTPNGTPTPEPDNEPRKRRRRVVTARAAAAVEQEDGAEETIEDPKPKRVRKPRRGAASTTATSTPLSVTPLATPALPDTFEANPMEDPLSLTRFAELAGPSMQRKPSGPNGAWSDEDRDLFLQLLAQYGDDFKRIAASMPNKTTVQVGAFYRAHVDDMNLSAIAANAPKRSPTPEVRQGVWKHATFTGPSVSFHKTRPLTESHHDMRPVTENYHQTLGGSGSSTPTSGIPGPAIGAFPYHPSPYETVRVPYGYHRPPLPIAEELAPTSMSTMHVHHAEPIANPSPFATAPLTTRFSSFPYRNFSPSHFTDNPAPSFSAASMQSSYAQNAGAHESAPYIAKMSNMSNSNYR